MLRNMMDGKHHFKMDRSERRWLVSWMMVVGAGIGLISAPMMTSASSIESEVVQAASACRLIKDCRRQGT